jgi:hypothetical protein
MSLYTSTLASLAVSMVLQTGVYCVILENLSTKTKIAL